MTTHVPPSFTPRLLEHEDGSSTRSGWRPPEHTLRGALAGAEAAIGSWLVIVVVTVAAYVATAAAPELGTASWLDAARVGSAIWLLGHGGALTLAGASVTLVPLGVTLIGLAGVATSVRRARLAGWWPVLTAVAVYTAFAGGFAALAGTAGSWRGVVGAVVVSSVGVLVAMRGRYPAPVRSLLDRIPEPVRVGMSAGLRVTGVLLALGLLAVIGSLVLGFSQVMDVHRSLVPDLVSSVIIVVAQIVLAPTLVVWGTAFLVGPGFAVGDGTLFAPTGIDAGPLPVVPVLGALPQPGSVAGSLGIVVVLGVLVGAAAGWWLRRRHPMDLPASAGAVVTTAVVAALLLGLLAALSSGSVGPGRMATMGPDAVAVALAALWQVALGATLTALLTHAGTRDLVGRGAALLDRARR